MDFSIVLTVIQIVAAFIVVPVLKVVSDLRNAVVDLRILVAGEYPKRSELQDLREECDKKFDDAFSRIAKVEAKTYSEFGGRNA